MPTTNEKTLTIYSHIGLLYPLLHNLYIPSSTRTPPLVLPYTLAMRAILMPPKGTLAPADIATLFRLQHTTPAIVKEFQAGYRHSNRIGYYKGLVAR